jgi:hypothetical protein
VNGHAAFMLRSCCIHAGHASPPLGALVDVPRLCIVHCALCIVHCALCIVHCALCIVHCALCIVHCVLCFVFCALYGLFDGGRAHDSISALTL